MGKSCGSFSGAAESEKTATLWGKAGVEAGRAPCLCSFGCEGLCVQSKVDRYWVPYSTGWTVLGGRDPSENTIHHGYARHKWYQFCQWQYGTFHPELLWRWHWQKARRGEGVLLNWVQVCGISDLEMKYKQKCEKAFCWVRNINACYVKSGVLI